MILETKHLAPYLPYGLKVYDVKNEIHTMISVVDNGFNKHIMTNLNAMMCTRTNIEHCKPILRPLSDSEKFFSSIFDDDIDVRTFLNDAYIGDDDSVYENWEDFLNHKPEFWLKGAFDVFVKYNFDVFGLIPNGLAIDINTIKE